MAQNKNEQEAAANEQAAAQETQVAQTVSTTDLASITGDDIKVSLQRMKPQERISFLRKISEFVGAETEDTNRFLNIPIKVVGMLIHQATVNRGSVSHVDAVTGEVTETPQYAQQNRTVFKLEGGKVLGFVSISIENYARDFLAPAFGMGDWVDENGNPLAVEMKIQQVTAKGGRAYSIQVL